MAKETLLTLRVRRALNNGLVMHVKGHRCIEDFFIGKSAGATTLNTGAFQHHPSTPDQVVRFYDGAGDLIVQLAPDGDGFYGALAKRSVLFDGTLCNLSFLRLVGLSAPEGLDLSIPGVFPLDIMQQWVENASALTRIFYRSHMAPFDFCVTTTIDRTMRIAGE